MTYNGTLDCNNTNSRPGYIGHDGRAVPLNSRHSSSGAGHRSANQLPRGGGQNQRLSQNPDAGAVPRTMILPCVNTLTQLPDSTSSSTSTSENHNQETDYARGSTTVGPSSEHSNTSYNNQCGVDKRHPDMSLDTNSIVDKNEGSSLAMAQGGQFGDEVVARPSTHQPFSCGRCGLLHLVLPLSGSRFSCTRCGVVNHILENATRLAMETIVPVQYFADNR